MKLKFYLALILAIAFAPLTRADPLNGVYATTNNVILPDYTIQFAQVIGATNGYSNFVTQAVWKQATNAIITNAAAANAATSNTIANAIFGNSTNTANNLTLGGFGNTTNAFTSNNVTLGGMFNSLNTTYNSGAIGGVGNSVVGSAILPVPSGSFTLGGTSNTLGSPQVGTIIAGGILNRSQDAYYGVMAGGTSNLLGFNHTDNSAIIGGSRNAIYGGQGNFIGGGISNTVGGLGSPNSWGTAFGVGARALNEGVFVVSDTNGFGGTFNSTAPNQVLFRASGGFGIGTNNPGTNQLRIGGNGIVDIEGTTPTLIIGGTNINALLNQSATSNGLSIIWNANLTTTSNGLQTQITTLAGNVSTISNSVNILGTVTTNNLTTTSNALLALINTTSNNAVQVGFDATNLINTASNAVQVQIDNSERRAGSITIFNNDTSALYSFSTPMPDTSYSVAFVPVDASTASMPPPYFDSATAGHFIAHILFSTNSFDCHYRFIVQHDNP